MFFSFPGLNASEDVLSFIKLLTSKNPDNSNIVKFAYEIARQPCGRNYISCPQGYVLDSVNYICYLVKNDLTTQFSTTPICPPSYTLIQFYNDAEVDGFIQLIKTG